MRTSPARKATAVRDLDPDDTLYLGDGANDRLAFDEASCTGTPVVDKGMLENRADFCFPGRSLGFVSTLLTTARQRQLSGHMNPLVSAILMPLGSLVTLAIVALHFRRTGIL